MNLLAWSKISALLSLSVFLGFGSYLVWTSAQSEKAVTAQTVVVLKHTDKTLSGVDAVVAKTGSAVSGVQNDVAYVATSLDNTLRTANPVIKKLGVAGDGLNSTLTIINRPCASKDTNGLLLPDGTLCTLDKTVVKVGDILVTSQRQEKDVADAAKSNMAAVNLVANDLHDKLSDKRTDDTLTYFRDIAKSGSGIVADGKTASDYAVKQFTTPKTFLQRVRGYSGDAFDIGAFLARHY